MPLPRAPLTDSSVCKDDVNDDVIHIRNSIPGPRPSLLTPTKLPRSQIRNREETEEQMLGGAEDRSPAALTVSAGLRQQPEDDDCQDIDSPRQISAAPARPSPTVEAFDDDGDDDADESEFEFVGWSDEIDQSITADEMFSDGRIRPVYPVFDRDLLIADDGDGDGEIQLRHPLSQLLLEDSSEAHSSLISSSSPSSADDVKGIPPESYCIWNPNSSERSPRRVRKSCSTGSSFRWKIRDLVIGRSQSDGKEKFVFLSAEDEKTQQKPDPAAAASAVDGEKKKKVKGKGATEVDINTVHRMYYSRNRQGAVAHGSASRRKSYLPYRPDIIGFFANVNGLSRAHHPF
ncbi:hypothetical protein AXF42_Ash017176 [Apostasia shenzhenica]|uniref:Uncharacterized protein n=1 Tax=Apostasia shenzhenica TaxID=1088818 RepID=A0A2H9ZVA4_9ASPA|nr:hypothetical protein AXF42_Ash017176 [Apostasia shenzhenica]